MKVIICGAGIAGLTLGLHLAPAGCQVVILEAAPALRDQGYMIDLFGPGYDTAQQLGLLAPLRQLSYQIPEVVWVDVDCRQLAALHYQNVSQVLGGRLLTLMRGDLTQVLFRALPTGVDVRFGSRVQEIRQTGDAVEARVSSGKWERADVLIGADGFRSRVRTLLFGDAGVSLPYLGLHTAAFVFEDAPSWKALGGRFVMMSVPGRQAGFYPIRSGRVAAFFAHHMPTAALPASPVAALQQQYGHLGWLIPTALQHARQRSSLYYDCVGQVRLARWGIGRVALVGDACHAVSLVAGQGASLAMSSAQVLAEELLSMSSPEQAFARYESRQKPLIERKQRSGRRLASWFFPESWWQSAARNVALRVADRAALSWILRPLIA